MIKELIIRLWKQTQISCHDDVANKYYVYVASFISNVDLANLTVEEPYCKTFFGRGISIVLCC